MDAWEQPVLVKRGRREQIEAGRDREFLEWIARFRFVTVDVLSERFGVSIRQANARVSALESAGMVVCVQDVGSRRRAVVVSRKGTTMLGLAPRRAPRPAVQREHELAIADLAAQIETSRPDVRVLTEREGRRQEASNGQRCSVDVLGRGGRHRLRWPDLILETGEQRVAVEIELAAKTTERLRDIVSAYAVTPDFGAVRFLVGSAALAARIEKLCTPHRRSPVTGVPRRVQLTVAPWPGATSAQRRRIEAAIARA